MTRWLLVGAMLVACSEDGADSSDAAVVDGALQAADAVELADTAADAAETPDAGPRQIQVGYQALESEYTPPDGIPRTLTVNVWYPTLATEGEPPRYLGSVLDNDALTDAPPMDGTFPLLAYSHGDRGLAGDAAHLHRHFVRQGWVVVAPDHAGNTLRDVEGINTVTHYQHRPLDLSHAMDVAAERFDLGPMLAAGHSRGATTMWAVGGATYDQPSVRAQCDADETCTDADLPPFADGFRDPRVEAVVVLAGGVRRGWLGADGHRSVEVPVLWLTGTEDGRGVEAEFPTFAGQHVTWVDFAGGCHLSFTLGACPTLEREVGFELIQRYTFAFARRHLFDDASVVPLLDGETAVDGAEVRTHRP